MAQILPPKTWSKKIGEGLHWLIKNRPQLLLAVLTLLWLLPGSGSLPLVDRDEPRFAYATQEMADRGSNVVPYFNDEYRFDKPPLVYWWMRLNYALLGYNDLAARLHSILATIIVALVIYHWARRMYPEPQHQQNHTAWWSAFAFVGCMQVFLHGRLCVADMAMMIFIVGALWAAWELLQKPSWAWAALFWSMLGLGFTTKWLVPLAVVGGTALMYIVFTRQWRMPWLKNFKPVSGLTLMIGIILCWAIPAWIETQGSFIMVGVGHHVLQRSMEGIVAGRGRNLLFYLLTAFVSLIPWLGLIGATAVWVRRNWGPREQYLTATVAITYIIFSISSTQLPHYVLPAWPSLLILITAATGLYKPTGMWVRRIWKSVYILWASIAVLAAVITVLLPIEGVGTQVKVAALLVIIALGSLLWLGWARAHGQYIAMAGAFLITPMAFWVGAAVVRPLTPALQIKKSLDPVHTPEVLIASGLEEPSLTAYTQATWQYTGDTPAAIERYNSLPNAALVVLAKEYTLESIPDRLLQMPPKARRDFQKILRTHTPIGGVRLRQEGLNLGRFSWVEYELYMKP